MTILVVGGAGYIGSHMVLRLVEEGEPVAVLDNLSTGFRDAVVGGTFIEGDCGDIAAVKDAIRAHDVDVVMHFASCIQVGESVTNPLKYYDNNVSRTINLLTAMHETGVRNFVFSSTAAVYGDSESSLIDETHPCRPINPYGRSKRMMEQVLSDCADAYGLRFFALRYFNAAGADPLTRLGERHDPETHLIPLVLRAASGRRPSISVFGRDYPTPDGTCIRDYIHVDDLCEAHLLAVRALQRGEQGGFFNVGNSRGYSVAEVIGAARDVTGRPIEVIEAERRAGDPAVLVADAKKLLQRLAWRGPKYGLHDCIEHAWKFELAVGEGKIGHNLFPRS
jgi:UDP-glucose 4-epimerase